MKLSITTNHGLKLLDVVSGEFKTIHEGGRFYFGLTWSAAAILAGFHRDRRSNIVSINASLEPARSVRVSDIAQANQHGMFFCPHTSRLFTTLSGKDSICYSGDMETFEPWIVDRETDVEWKQRTGGALPMKYTKTRHGVPLPPEQQPKPWTAPGQSNLHHWNSVFTTADRIYLMAHNHGPSEIYEFTHDRQLVSRTPYGRMSHTVWHDGAALYCVDSGGSCVLRNRETVYQAKPTEFPRGIAWDGTHYYLGVSTRAERDERMNGRGKIRVLTEDWQPVRDIDLPDGCSQVYEIRALCADGRTHNGLRPPIE